MTKRKPKPDVSIPCEQRVWIFGATEPLFWASKVQQSRFHFYYFHIQLRRQRWQVIRESDGVMLSYSKWGHGKAQHNEGI